MCKPGLLMGLLLFFSAISAQLPLYKDRRQPVEIRVKDLLSRMTVEEKFWQLFMIPGDLDAAKPGQYKNGIFGFQVSASGAGDITNQLLKYNTGESAAALARKINAIQKYFVEQTRLGIPIIAFDEALHGLVRGEATVFPQAIALAASFDTTLMKKAADAIAGETKASGIRQILSPVINIASDPRWGRTEETYGEDPFLSSLMGVSFIKAFEEKNIIATPKHFIANVGDGGRDSYPIHMNERLLEEIYFPPFKAAIEKGGARSIMTAYNSLDGQACSANPWLLLEKLKKQWGFKGFVISDANAVGGELVLHKTAKDYAESGEHAINNGLDVIFQTDYAHHSLFLPPFLENKIDSARLNDAVARVLRAKFELGLFENPYVTVTEQADLFQSNKTIAKEAALKSFVLLKNEEETLPLSPKIKTILITGPDAAEARMGGYSGAGNDKISILDGIRQRAGKQWKVLYEKGCDRKESVYAVIPSQYLEFNHEKGLQGLYYASIDFSGEPVLKRTDKTIDFRWTLYGPSEATGNRFYAAKWNGQFIAPVTGTIQIGLEGNDGYRLYFNEQLLIDRWKKASYHTTLETIRVEKGKSYPLEIDFFETTGNAALKLVWDYGVNNEHKTSIAKAVAAARKSDVVIVAAGIEEGEFSDRALLSLPGQQEKLIRSLAQTGKPVIVLLTGGSAVTMQSWIGDVKAIGLNWYAGERGGEAIAQVLFGDYNPAGRLPITFPQHEAQLPLVYNHKPTGRGDDYNNLSGEPLFPFGYGLSYTNFEYKNLRLSRSSVKAGDTVMVSFTLFNTGKRDGEEVVQLYIQDELASVARPVLELKGVQRVRLKAGESKEIFFTIAPEMLKMLDKDLKEVLEPGVFRIMIGASSKDLRLRCDLELK